MCPSSPPIFSVPYIDPWCDVGHAKHKRACYLLSKLRVYKEKFFVLHCNVDFFFFRIQTLKSPFFLLTYFSTTFTVARGFGKLISEMLWSYLQHSSPCRQKYDFITIINILLWGNSFLPRPTEPKHILNGEWLVYSLYIHAEIYETRRFTTLGG